MPKIIEAVIADAISLGSAAQGTPVPGAAVASLLGEYLRRRGEAARDLLLEELRKGKITQAEYAATCKAIDAELGVPEAEAKSDRLNKAEFRAFVAVTREPAQTWDGLLLKIAVAREYADADPNDTNLEEHGFDTISLAAVFKDAERLSGRAI